MEYGLSTKIDNLKERVGETFRENLMNEKTILTNIKKKRALITGITGQDGSYLAEFLLGKGYEVYGMHRRTSMDVFERIGDLRREIKLVEGDVTDQGSIIRIINEIHPDEVYNLAAQSFVPDSWTQPISTVKIDALGVINMLDAIRLVDPKIKFYQASTSEMFGKVQEVPQTERTPFYPRSPYAASKSFGHYITQNYRESFMFLHAVEFYLIMNLQEEENNLLQEKSVILLQR
jgi:GDPmannose 4,6-dehydratase